VKGVAQLDVFAAIRQAQHGTASRHSAEIDALVPLCRSLALKAGVHGVTVHDLRLVAAQRGMLPYYGKGRELCWLCAVPKKAGLVSTGRKRISPDPEVRNYAVCYVHPMYAENR